MRLSYFLPVSDATVEALPINKNNVSNAILTIFINGMLITQKRGLNL